MVIRKYFSVILLLVLSVSFLEADMSTAITLKDYNIVSRMADGSFDMVNYLTGDLAFKNKGNRNVKAELLINTVISDVIVWDISKAYLKVKFPWFIMMAGKNRVSWGDGFLFNAGDLIFEGTDLPSLSGELARTQTLPLFSVTKYLDKFTFLEVIGLPEFATQDLGPYGIFPDSVDLESLSAGVRFNTKIAKTVLEAGYLYKGADQSHNMALTAHGSILGVVDCYTAGTLAIIQDNVDEQLIQESLGISVGFMSSIGLDGGSNLSLNLEGVIHPFREWEELEVEPVGTAYGLYLYTGISLSPQDNLSCGIDGILSPIDGSGYLSAKLDWNVYQGFSAGLSLAGMYGDSDDHFKWESDGDLSFSLNFSYKFGK